MVDAASYGFYGPAAGLAITAPDPVTFWTSPFDPSCSGSSSAHNYPQRCSGCHGRPDPLFWGYLAGRCGRSPPAVEVGVSTGCQLLTACTDGTGRFLFSGAGQIDWSRAEVRIRDASGERVSAHPQTVADPNCALCHTKDSNPILAPVLARSPGEAPVSGGGQGGQPGNPPAQAGTSSTGTSPLQCSLTQGKNACLLGGSATQKVQAWVSEENSTDAAGQSSDVVAEFGWGSSSDPEQWTWSSTTYLGDNGAPGTASETCADEFSADFAPSGPGAYWDGIRFRSLTTGQSCLATTPMAQLGPVEARMLGPDVIHAVEGRPVWLEARVTLKDSADAASLLLALDPHLPVEFGFEQFFTSGFMVLGYGRLWYLQRARSQGSDAIIAGSQYPAEETETQLSLLTGFCQTWMNWDLDGNSWTSDQVPTTAHLQTVAFDAPAGGSPDACATVAPEAITVQTTNGILAARSDPIYGEVLHTGLTENSSQALGIAAEFGWGSGDPSTWYWAPAPYDSDSGDRDRYQQAFHEAGAFQEAGTRSGQIHDGDHFAFRFSSDGGTTWMYCNLASQGGTVGDGFDLAKTGVVHTVSSP